MEEHVNTNANEKCANPSCARTASSGTPYCDTCELEWTLYRRDLRGREREKEEEGLAVESR